VPPRIVTILGRLRQDLTADLSPDAIKPACQEEKDSWRDRILNPVITIYPILLNRKLHGVFRAHQRPIIDFTPGRPQATGRKGKKLHEATIRPRSRWVLSPGESDQVVIWHKPKSQPRWMSKDE
jgi:hypothetical protein